MKEEAQYSVTPDTSLTYMKFIRCQRAKPISAAYLSQKMYLFAMLLISELIQKRKADPKSVFQLSPCPARSTPISLWPDVSRKIFIQGLSSLPHMSTHLSNVRCKISDDRNQFLSVFVHPADPPNENPFLAYKGY